MKKQILYISILLLSFSGHAQTVKEVLEKASAYYANTHQYQLSMTYTLFRGLSGDRATESYTGTMTKVNNYSQISVLNTTVFQFPEARLVIDEDRKIVAYSEIGSTENVGSPVDVSSFLQYYSEAQILDKGTYWQCELVAEKKALTNLPYGKVILDIDKRDYQIRKQELFFANLIPFKDKNGELEERDYGRLIIQLKQQGNDVVETKTLGDFILKTASNKIQLQQPYAAYELIDQTEYNK